jgi:glycosyltransferase involved in cell wall biosynthesis
MLSSDGICERCKGGRLHNVLKHRCIKGSAALSGVIMVEAMVHRLLGSYSQCVSRFAVPSRFYIDKLTQWGMPAHLFRHVPNFVDAARFEPDYSPGKAFLYFGRLSHEKGLPTLIRAAGAAGTPLSVVGTGMQVDELRQLAQQSRADVTFLGYLTGDALRNAVKSARAVVLPSEWYENAPMSVLEAYALGKPVLGARIGGIPEMVRENETGLTFASGDVESLAASLRSFMALPVATVEEMGRRGRRWVETEFTADLYRDRILDIYKELGVRISREMPLPVTV